MKELNILTLGVIMGAVKTGNSILAEALIRDNEAVSKTINIETSTAVGCIKGTLAKVLNQNVKKNNYHFLLWTWVPRNK